MKAKLEADIETERVKIKYPKLVEAAVDRIESRVRLSLTVVVNLNVRSAEKESVIESLEDELKQLKRDMIFLWMN